jgi:hypothetical protein
MPFRRKKILCKGMRNYSTSQILKFSMARAQETLNLSEGLTCQRQVLLIYGDWRHLQFSSIVVLECICVSGSSCPGVPFPTTAGVFAFC